MEKVLGGDTMSATLTPPQPSTRTPTANPVVPPVPAAQVYAPATYPRVRRWTCDDLYRLREWRDVWFGGAHFHLIDGEIYEMPAPGPLHSTAATVAEQWCYRTFADGFVVRVEKGLPFGINTDPIPDIAVVAGSARDFRTAHPTTAELVIEIADTTLAHDTGDKASLYAAAGIRDYWVIDVDGRRLILFRDPQPDTSGRYGHGYATQTILSPTDTVAPLAAPAAVVTVGDLLP
jgi:Uma2 family endonuclease